MNMHKGGKNNYIKEIQNYFWSLWKRGKPIAKLFKTRKMSYLYDTGSNKVLRCEPHVFDLLGCFFKMDIEKAIHAFLSKYDKDKFLDAAGKIKGAIEKENILLARGATQFGLGEHYTNLEERIASSLGMITLEVTEQCNLRCEYCIYNPQVKHARSHSSQEMSIDIAYRGIEYLKKHSYNKEKVAITFYGGEPLLRFEFLKSCAEYARSIIKDKKIIFSITTNGTLISPEIASYFYHNNFSIVVSIDGPRKIHDNYRKDIHGKGSFDKSIQGLKLLIDSYGDKAADQISLSMVYSPPYSGEKIDRIASLWDEFLWLPKNMNVNITYPSIGSIPLDRFTRDDMDEDKKLDTWCVERYAKKFMGIENGHPISDNIEEKKLAFFMQRKIYNSPFDKYFLNGCCVPGVRKLFIGSDGTFRVCEKISIKAPSIGNVFAGIDIDTLKQIYIDGYEKISLPHCNRCWAIRLCNICYVQAFRNGNLDADRKSLACESEIYLKERLLKLFGTLIEKKPNGLDYLYKLQLE